MIRRRFGRGSVAFFGLILLSSSATRGEFASAFTSYVAGALDVPLTNPLAAIGMPMPDTGFGMLTPFNPSFGASDLVGIGPGGHLVLQLGAPAPTGAGRTIAVHAAVGLIDTDWPNGNVGAVAAPFTNPRVATVGVSADNVTWHSLGLVTFDMPTNFFSQGITTPGFQEQPGTQVADFGKPFVASLTDFNGRDWNGVLSLLDGSGGGNWLDLSAVPFANVNFIRFDVGVGQRMILDAVAIVPEPLAAGTGAVMMLFVLQRRRA